MALSVHADGAQQSAAIKAELAMLLTACTAVQCAQHGAGSMPASKASNSARVAAGRMD
jgi:hypothetical protein